MSMSLWPCRVSFKNIAQAGIMRRVESIDEVYYVHFVKMGTRHLEQAKQGHAQLVLKAKPDLTQ